MSVSRLDELRSIRLAKLEQLKKLGLDPYPSKYHLPAGHVLSPVSDARTKHGHEVSVAGRLWHIRTHGQVTFADLKDSSGQIQLMFRADSLSEKYQLLKLLDSGDFLGVTGIVISTQSGEVTVEISSFEILSKSLRPVPDDWFGLKDEEARLRERYVDLLLDEKLRDVFRKKAVFWQSMRSFLVSRGFLEVETPVLENIFGGADANPFVTHHDALDLELYLRISMGELWQKRLMVGGFEKTFEIGRQFRNEGLSREHLQDYSQMEFYWAYADYLDSMKLVEEMYKYVALETFGRLNFEINGHFIDLEPAWDKLDFSQSIRDHLHIDIAEAEIGDLRSKLAELKVPFSHTDDRGRLLDLLWKQVRKSITGPVFLTGHPVDVSPLAKRQLENPGFTERYQVIIGGSEMGNGYSELNDPLDQAERFRLQQEMRDRGDKEAQMYDRDFVTALEYGMPPVTGFGVSERLFAFLVDKPVRETVLFPLLRPDNK